MWRRQLPTHSPVSLPALTQCLAAMASGNALLASKTLTKRLSDRYQPLSVVLTDSGTSALQRAMEAAISFSGRNLIALPAYSCYDVATAADGVDASVVFYDLDPRTLAPDKQSLERAVAEHPCAVVIAHLYGVPANLQPVRDILEDSILIEDAAQGHGARTNGEILGCGGDIAILSFGRGKGIASGGGGAMLVHDARVATVAESMNVSPGKRGIRNWLGMGVQWLFGRPSLYVIPSVMPFLRLGETLYRKPRPVQGISDMAPTMLELIWDQASIEAGVRRKTGARWLETLRQFPELQSIQIDLDASPGYLRFPVLVPSKLAHEVRRGRGRALGVMPGYPEPLTDLKPFADRCVNARAAFPGARLLADRLITLPTHSLVTRGDERHINELLRS